MLKIPVMLKVVTSTPLRAEKVPRAFPAVAVLRPGLGFFRKEELEDNYGRSRGEVGEK